MRNLTIKQINSKKPEKCILTAHSFFNKKMNNGANRLMVYSLCKCGNYTHCPSEKILKGHTTSCGCRKNGNNITPPHNSLKLKGKVFSRVTILYVDINNPKIDTYWVCKCICGKLCSIKGSLLKSGNTKSCGCLSNENRKRQALSTIHGHTVGRKISKTYTTWCSMKNRCYYKKHEHYKYYGGRGITICERWKNSFKYFIEDMGERPENYTLDRIDNDKGYSKENCRWATWKEQAANKRKKL